VKAVFTEEELSKFNGSEELSVLIAYDGKVYDVTTSYHWRGGKHHALHQAGQDLTAIMEKSPHGIDLLKGFPIVGVLKKGRLSQDPKF
jgi:predicted heme/steroid binding protein